MPLTFSHLWGTRDPDQERAINLRMMTTNLTHGRPYRLPFEENVFYFHPDEFKKLFPVEVVEWMIENPRETDDPDKYAPLRPMPAAADLPVIFATRLSISFPFLLSAVPLYAIDFGKTTDDGSHAPEPCWFSDGGICSNFPVHFFDSMLPRWPTFAINLRYVKGDPELKVWMPKNNREGVLESWTRLDQASNENQSNNLLRFFNAIQLAMQNWSDNTLLSLPGYRDRIVHIYLNEAKEGGLNLNMPPEVIKDLAERGRAAGRELLDHYASDNPDVETNWDNHRWIRYRFSMSLIEIMLNEFLFFYTNPLPGDRSYDELITRENESPPNSYRWRSKAQREFAVSAMEWLVEFARKRRPAIHLSGAISRKTSRSPVRWASSGCGPKYKFPPESPATVTSDAKESDPNMVIEAAAWAVDIKGRRRDISSRIFCGTTSQILRMIFKFLRRKFRRKISRG